MELGLRFLAGLVFLLFLITEPIFRFYAWLQRKPRKRLPSLDPILKQSVTKVSAQIITKQITSEKIVSAVIKRIRLVNPILNAIVEERFDQALQEAKIVDQKIKQLDEKEIKKLASSHPLLGVPITIKESCSVKGLSLVVGSLKRLHMVAEKDGECVSLLRDAGAIVILVSNTPENCLCWETNNLITGKTFNPYNLERTAGGSSGGEGALIGSGASLVGIGSDLAGSIRIPALYNGIFGHKPTPNVVPLEGHFPFIEEIRNFLVIGPITRYAEDLTLMLKVMSGPNADQLQLDTKVEISTLKAHYTFQGGFSFTAPPLDPEIEKATFQAIQYLETKNVSCQKVDLEELEDVVEMCLTVFFSMKNIPNFLEKENSPKQSDNLLIELAKTIVGLSKYSAFTLGFEFVKMLQLIIPQAKKAIYFKKFYSLKEKLLKLLEDDGIFLYPTHLGPAHFHNQVFLLCPGVMYTMLFNCLGLPSCHVPLGLNSNGLPIGIQVIAAPYKDRLCLKVAEELEKGFGGWVPPPQL